MYKVTNRQAKYRWQDPSSGITIPPGQTVKLSDKVVAGRCFQRDKLKKQPRLIIEKISDKPKPRPISRSKEKSTKEDE